MKARVLLCLIAAALAGAASAWSGEPALVRAAWRLSPILVDGSDSDWSPQAGAPEGPFSVAFLNDRRDLYVLVRPAGDAARASLAQGDVSVWLDATGEGTRRLGVRLPAPGPGQTQADRVPALTGPAAPTIAASVPRNDPIVERMGDGAAGVLELRVPLTVFGNYLPRSIAVGIESAALEQAPADDDGGGEGASAARRGGWQQGRDDDGGFGGGRYVGRPEAGGRGASLPPPQSAPSAVWFRMAFARSASRATH